LKPKYRLLIFDLDGTLVDTAPDISDCANRVFREMGFPERSMKDVTQAIGRGVRDLMRRLIGPLNPGDAALARAVELFRETYAANLVRRSELYPGVREALEGPLKDFKKAIVTNKPHALAVEMLRIVDLERCFDSVIGAGGAFAPKPDAAAVLHVMRELGATPHETLFIGDSSIDWETANKASIDFAWVPYGYEDLSTQRPHIRFNDATEWRKLANGNFR
jgi:phosphoglycolate phosphatase